MTLSRTLTSKAVSIKKLGRAAERKPDCTTAPDNRTLQPAASSVR